MQSGCVLGRLITWPDFHFKKMVLELPEENGLMGQGAGGAVRRLLHKSRKKDGKAWARAGRKWGLRGRQLSRSLGGKWAEFGL